MSPPLYGQMSELEIAKVVASLEIADHNHRDWLKRLHISLVCNKPFGDDVVSEIPEHYCEFGRWYYNHVPEALKSYREFIELEPLHKIVHDSACRLAILSRDHTRQVPVGEYETFIDNQRAFSTALWVLRDHLREHLYSFDTLTGLMTRRPFAVILESEYARIERGVDHSCIVMIDIDHFKSINDRYGHLVGDHVLRDVAQYIRSHIRAYDSACRYGGEEFLIILPDTSLREAYEIIDRLRQKIAEKELDIDGEPVAVTISAGVARLSEHGSSSSVGEADRALYRAKRSGRNRVCLAHKEQNQSEESFWCHPPL